VQTRDSGEPGKNTEQPCKVARPDWKWSENKSAKNALERSSRRARLESVGVEFVRQRSLQGC